MQVFQTHVLSVSSIFRRMLQVLYLDVSKVDRVLHMLQCDPPAAGAGGGSTGRARRRRRLLGPGGGADAAWAQVGRIRHKGSDGT